MNAEANRLKKEIASVRTEIVKISKKLDNPNFSAKAPVMVVEENRRRLDEENTRLETLIIALERLK